MAKLTKFLLPALCMAGLGMSTAQAAIQINDSIDGAWADPNALGRGALVDFIPSQSIDAANVGNGTFFMILFTYDTAGAPLWLTLQTTMGEQIFSASNVEVRRFSGGSFGGNQASPPSTVFGTANITINTCDSLSVAITPTATGFTPTTLNLSRSVFGAGAIPASCVWRTAFTTCPAGTTAVAGQARTCALPQSISADLSLPNNATYTIPGAVQVGSGFGTSAGASTGTIATRATLTIAPGTVLKGAGGTLDYLLVNAGSRIVAEGTPEAPIIFTGPTNTPGTWGGIVLAGQAIANNCIVSGTTLAGSCTFEAGNSVRYGGNDANDSSGVIRYAQIRYGGQVIATDREFNSLTLLSVGRGTTLEYIQTHAGIDDGFEMFGGSVNLRYVVATRTEDDSFDFDNGYNGRIQFAYGQAGGSVNNDSNGIESDNQPSNGNFNAQPRTQPVISNMTLIGVAGANEGVRIRRGSGGNYFNLVVAGSWPAECLNFNDADTFTVGGTPTAPGPALTMRNSWLGGCTTVFEDSTSEPYLVSAWYNGQTGNGTGNALLEANRFPAANSPLLGTGITVPNEAFFTPVNFKGAFSGRGGDWTVGWTLPGSLGN